MINSYKSDLDFIWYKCFKYLNYINIVKLLDLVIKLYFSDIYLKDICSLYIKNINKNYKLNKKKSKLFI